MFCVCETFVAEIALPFYNQTLCWGRIARRRDRTDSMKTIETLSDLGQARTGCVLTIGNFDGVHRGHQEILAVAGRLARERRTELTAMTFEPHPVAVLYPEKAPGVLTPLAIKRQMLAQFGVDTLIVLDGDAELLMLSPDDFAARFLVENIQPSVVVEGCDFNFGAERAGNIETLKEFGSRKGFEVCVVEPKQIKLSTGQLVRVSSTMIRYMIESGHVADAAAALGRPYRLVENIIPGRGIGKKLGFPTLNMKKPTQVIPAEAVYAGFVAVGESLEGVLRCDEMMPAACSIGQARTYGDDFPLLIEAHLLDQRNGAVPGQHMAMDFVKRIRAQRKFSTPEELSRQIAKDCDAAKEILTA
jgi:riboflavin kinase/FMN adenylyltransferase